MSWASSRRTYIVGAILVLLVAVLGVPVYFSFFHEVPSCTDGKQNGDEAGIDCGGSCARICVADAREIQILWSRSFPVIDGIFNSVAYLENANSRVIAQDVPYSFKLFDSENILIAERKGAINLSGEGIIPVFEASIETGNRVPVRTFFEFLEVPLWERDVTSLPALSVTGIRLTGEDASPRVDAVIENRGPKTVTDIEAIVVVFDVSGNALASSRTTVSRLPGNSSQPLVFTWPQAFPGASSKIEIIPRVIR